MFGKGRPGSFFDRTMKRVVMTEDCDMMMKMMLKG